MPLFIFGCSPSHHTIGPGSIHSNEVSAYIHAAILGVLLVYSFALTRVISRSRLTRILIALLVLHPAWTISAIHGDCGYMKRDVSIAFSVVGGLVFAYQWGRIVQREARAWQSQRLARESATHR